MPANWRRWWGWIFFIKQSLTYFPFTPLDACLSHNPSSFVFLNLIAPSLLLSTGLLEATSNFLMTNGIAW